MNRKIIYRIILDLIIILLVFNALWFFALPLSLLGAWFLPNFIEIIIAGIAYDSLFGMGNEMGVYGYVGTIVSILILIVVWVMKKVVRE